MLQCLAPQMLTDSVIFTAMVAIGILGIYVYMFFSLPFASKMYVVFSRLFGKKIDNEGSAKVGENA